MPPVYGNDFSAVEGADLQQRAMDQAASQASMNRLISSLQANRQFQYQTQVANPQEFAFRNRQLDIEQDLATRRLAAEGDRNAISQGYLDAYKQQLPKGAALTPAQERDNEFTWRTASGYAENGMFDSADHAQKLFPNLSPPQANLLAQRSADVRPAREEQFRGGERVANLMNTYEHATDVLHSSGLKDDQEPEPIYTNEDPKEVARVLNVDPTAVKKSKWLHGTDDTQTRLRKALVIQAYMAKSHIDKSGVLPQLKRSGAVGYDAETQSWVNQFSRPRWLQPLAPPGGGAGGGGAQPLYPPGSQPTEQYQPGQLNPLPGRTATAPAGPPVTGGTSTGTRMPPQFYDAVNRYAASGLSLPEAVQRAQTDWQQAQETNSLP